MKKESKKKDETVKEMPNTEETVKEEKKEAEPAENTETPKEENGENKETEKTAEDEALETKYLRLAADFQNFKKRTEKEKADIYSFANEKFALGLLDVIDNFERAIAVGTEDKKYQDGMELILKQMKDVLSKNNVEEIETEGKDFDPNFHNAVMTETVEGVEAGKITKVLQKGYMLNKKVIRPAMVAVAQ